ncbi:MAG: hypothetical protein CNE89_08630 [Sphingomonadaceae bacterium MED-G03]|nr:MAG: hypothetical protein CNE89_08630 [Sphingomonadaceae bacterium MED-G03]
MADPPSRCAVLDIEVGANPDAILDAEPRDSQAPFEPSLFRVTRACVLSFTLGTCAAPYDLRLTSLSRDSTEQDLVAKIDRALPECGDINRIITYNGRSWDLPMLVQRASATWCFSVPRIAAWSRAGPDAHVDMMRQGGPRGGRGWASLADRAAAIGIDMRFARGKPTGTVAATRRRCSADCAATFLLYCAHEAVHRGDGALFGGAWLALCALIENDPALMRDLRYFVDHPSLDGCRILAGRTPLMRIQTA